MTHRGINMASVAGEGLEDLAGLLILLFFVLAGLFVVRVWFGPSEFRAVDSWFALAWLLIAPAAIGAYMVGRRRDRQLTARLEQEFHRLSNGEVTAPPTTDREIEEFARTWKGGLGFGAFPAEELRRAARPSVVSPEALLVVAIAAFFVVAMVSIIFTFDPMEVGSVLWIGIFVVGAGGGIGYAYHRVQVRRRARTIERELNELK